MDAWIDTRIDIQIVREIDEWQLVTADSKSQTEREIFCDLFAFCGPVLMWRLELCFYYLWELLV